MQFFLLFKHIMERPKPGEDEDDLLKFQKEFLMSGSNSASSVSIKRPEKRRSDELKETRDVVKMEGL